MPQALTHNDILDRLIRTGGWAELALGTPRLITRSIDAGDDTTTVALADFFRDEMKVVFDIYVQWFRDTRRCLIDKGTTIAELDQAHLEIRNKLAAFHHSAHSDRNVVWAEIGAALDQVKNSANSVETRHEALENAVETWRDLHDCEVDQLAGLFDLVITRHGEAALREMYEHWVIGDWFAKRYQRFDVSKIDWEQASWLLIYLGFEGHHGHLSGADRDGSIDFQEDDEKVTISFAPCGSGGRSMQGESRDNLPPLSAAPLNWGELGEAHDFTWNETGICAYCAHCCLLHENLPIAEFGYPVRVTNPPRAPLTQKSRCSWTVYKDLRSIPGAAYNRVGTRKPPLDAPLGSATKTVRDAMMAEGGKNG